MARLSFRLMVGFTLTAAVLFSWGVVTDSFPPLRWQLVMTAVGLAFGACILWLYLRPPPTHPRWGAVGLTFVAASQVAFFLLVWTDAKQKSDLWRIWWCAGVPSLVAAHLRLLRLLEIDWRSKLGRTALASIVMHGAVWVMLVARHDLLANPPAWYVWVMGILCGASIISTTVTYYRFRKKHAGEPSPFPLWAKWTAISISQVVLVIAGVYVGRITGNPDTIFDAFPSALAGMPPEEIDAAVHADEGRLKTVTAGMEELSDRLPALRRKLEGAMKAEGREYLKAPEDDELRATYMTFLTYRSALLRHIGIYAGFEAVREPALKARCFLVAYVAATSLAASSGKLVVTFQDWPVARKKLNEPDPRWGISAGMFDRIAMGVASDSNVERFEEMAAYYDARKALWREEAVWPPAEMDWIEARIAKSQEAARALDVHAHRNWLNRVIGKVKSDAYSPVYAVQSQLSQWIGDTRVVARPPLISERQIEELKAKMQPGDIILERRNFFLSNAFLPGFWPHAVLYVGGEEGLKELGLIDQADVKAKLEQFRKPAVDGHRPAVIEAVSEGVIFNSLEHSVHADYVAVLRPRVSKEKKAEAVARAFANQGKPYDYDFDFFTTDKLVCTELVYRSYEGAVHFSLQHVMGRDTLPAVEIARKFATERGTPQCELDFVGFLDGHPSEGCAVFASEDDFCKSVDRAREFEQ